MIALEQVRAAVSAAADAPGVPELLAILARCEHDLATAHTAVQAVGRATDDLLEFQAALVRVRRVLEPMRDALLAYEAEVDALYWSRAASPAATQTVLAFLRHYQHLSADLAFSLPSYPHIPAASRRPPAAPEQMPPMSASDSPRDAHVAPDPTLPGAM